MKGAFRCSLHKGGGHHNTTQNTAHDNSTNINRMTTLRNRSACNPMGAMPYNHADLLFSKIVFYTEGSSTLL